MTIKKLTQAEATWLLKFKDLMAECPSKRFGAYTIGDADLVIYDKPEFDKYYKNLEKTVRDMPDDVIIHQRIGTVLDSVAMPFKLMAWRVK